MPGERAQWNSHLKGGDFCAYWPSLGRLCRRSNNLAPRVGLEPTTLRLTAECSTIELPRNDSTQALSLEQTPPRDVNFSGVPAAEKGTGFQKFVHRRSGTTGRFG